MSSSPTTQASLTNHYLQVQALTQVDTDPQSINTTTKPNQTASFFVPILLFIIVFFLGLITFIFSKFKSSSQLSNTLKLALLLAVVPVGLTLLSNQTRLRSKAGPDEIPQEITVTNLSPNNFTLSFTTQSPTLSGVQISSTPNMEQVFITKFSKDTIPVTQHTYQIEGLNSENTYYLRIYSQGVWYDNQGQPLSVTTPKP